jgi:hypothetical protein
MNDNNTVIMNESNVSENQVDYSKMSFIKRVIGVVCYPGKVMQSLKQKPRVLFGILLTAITTLVAVLAIYPMFMEFLENNLTSTYAAMNVEVSDQQMDMVLSISKFSAFVFGPIFALILMMLEALYLWVASKILKGQGSFKQILSVTGYSAVIAAIASIVSIIYTWIVGTYSDVSLTSLASLLPSMKGTFLFGALRVVEVFTIWQFVVIGIGYKTITKLSNKKVFIVIALIFAAFAIYYGYSEYSAAQIMQ